MNSSFLTVLRKCGPVCPLEAYKVENVIICRVVYVEPFLKAGKGLELPLQICYDSDLTW